MTWKNDWVIGNPITAALLNELAGIVNSPPPVLGTPTSGTLTNCTGLPVAGITASTATALGVGSVELGHASDTTIARSGAGDITVEGNAVYRAGGTDVPVTDGGTGRSTSTTAYGLIAAGTTATGAHQTLAAGATTDILVGGGASALPAWTTATGSGAPVRATSPTLVTPALGTPSSGTLTNCTGLPVAGIAASTSTALGVGTIELGHASDTTLSRSAAGVLAVEGVVVPTVTSTSTLTNKRVTPRDVTVTAGATPSINTDNGDFFEITGLTVDITSLTTNLTGTPTRGQKMWLAITGTASRAITHGASFEASTVALPTTTSGTNRLDIGYVWNSVTSKWRCVAVS